MVKRMQSDAFPLSSVDYEFIMQYRDAKPKTDILKKLRDKYPMTNSHFYKIWRGEEVHMVEWHQPISDESKTRSSDSSMIPLDWNLSIPESRLPNIDQASIAENSIVTSDKQVKNRKSRSFRDKSTIHKPTKKVGGKDDLYTLIERNCKETEEAEHESERILATK
ncbi:12720_t:CDS:1 [Entrophospora sp. SA101]|nr:12720_t:CDS:1 [Entrophospora sp. SA101]CAJ0907744.1 1320_t:CDS:1 [Entrophospora sp. SA101]